MGRTPFQSLSVGDRRDALEVAELLSGRPAYLLEKDLWVVETLRVLFAAPFGGNLTFKGGTSLSKAYHAIRRFSEDVDITYDIRALLPDLAADAGEEALPVTRSQERRWTRVIRARLAAWVREQALPMIEAGLVRVSLSVRVHAVADRVYVSYPSMFDNDSFVRPEVMVEFGARSTGEPHETRPVTCDAAAFLPDLVFPSARPTVMLAERTFWEKATAIHVFCRQERRRRERLSRHWHDLVRLDGAGHADTALADRSIALSVAHHKAMFFPEKDVAGNWINYQAAVSGDLQLCPTGPAHDALSDDYGRMLGDGMLLDDGESFEELIKRCANIETRANKFAADDKKQP